MNLKFEQPILGPKIGLQKLAPEHLSPLAMALYHKDSFFVQQRGFNSIEKTQAYLVEMQRDPNRLFILATLKDQPNEMVAVSSFFNTTEPLFKVEIGFTWVASKWQRTFVNTEMKLLMMTYAFETLNVKRVEFSVQPINQPSIKAMHRLGITFEGTLRKWRYNSLNDTGHRSIFSVIDDEWVETKSRLNKLLER